MAISSARKQYRALCVNCLESAVAAQVNGQWQWRCEKCGWEAHSPGPVTINPGDPTMHRELKTGFDQSYYLRNIGL